MGNDPFADMSHEEMLDWLDKVNPAIVQAGAEKLLAAADVIEKIATELKTRPQYVEWRGRGADSFRAWGGDLANAALRIADHPCCGCDRPHQVVDSTERRWRSGRHRRGEGDTERP
ncbi:hypothetical protein [Streptomyces sp. NPDC047869]|uniref:hypothetical protein n=1 Tax=Streptomyces sp. NPDC047869 TaxID=3154709 RepID=UPI003452890A